jgi:hypothetical protein
MNKHIDNNNDKHIDKHSKLQRPTFLYYFQIPSKPLLWYSMAVTNLVEGIGFY